MNDVLGLLVLAPLGGAVLAAAWSRTAAAVAFLTAAVTTTAAAITAAQVASSGAMRLELAGWGAPLGIDLQADGITAGFVLLTGVVGLGVTIYASASPTARGGTFYWAIWLALWAGLNAVYVSGDLFNIYVGLELATLAAVGLVVLGGSKAWAPALRYLFIAVLGSLAYLLGVGLVYGETGVLDIASAGDRLDHGAASVAALATMTVGMALKTAMFPLHAWLPPAHAAAPSAVSPILSALVVKASFYVLVRVWFSVFEDDTTASVAPLLGVLGTVGVVYGSVVALRQSHLKRLVAYSTIAQVGYLFLLFPLVEPGRSGDAGPTGPDAAAAGWTGALALALTHGLAKAAMFMSAGNLMLSYGSDRLRDLRGATAQLPMSAMTFAISGVALAGLPPTFGFVGKWQIVQSGLTSLQWWWLPVLLLGGLLTIAYTGTALRAMFTGPGDENAHPPIRRVPRRMDVTALVLAVLAVVLGLRSVELLNLLELGAPGGGG